MEKEKIAIDSCVFFSLIKFNKILKTEGTEKFNMLVNRLQENIHNREELLKQIIPVSILEKNNYSFDRYLIHDFESYIFSTKKNVSKKITSLKHVLQGFVITDGIKKAIPQLSEQKKQEISKKILELESTLKKIKNDCSLYRNIISGFIDRQNILNNALLFKKHLDGLISIFIPSQSLKEIRNHIFDPNKENEKLNFPESEVMDLLNQFSILSIHNESVVEAMDNIAKDYRTSFQKNLRPMDQDINSVNEYGDSTIMAECSMAGMILLTNNEKDFIFDNSNTSKNDNIRQHIKFVNEQNNACSNALPYSTKEYIDGSYTKPSKMSEIFDIVEVLDTNLQEYEITIK